MIEPFRHIAGKMRRFRGLKMKQNVYAWLILVKNGSKSQSKCRVSRLPALFLPCKSTKLPIICCRHNILVSGLEFTLFDHPVQSTNVRDFIVNRMLPRDNPPVPPAYLVMDNAAIHHAEIVLNAFANPTVEPLFLPVYSPHLNPVELIFATMKRRMAKHGRPRTRAALKEAVTAALQQLSVEPMAPCFREMRKWMLQGECYKNFV